MGNAEIQNEHLLRTACITAGASRKAAIEVAQALHRKFPAALDAPAFSIRVNWCRPTAPKCGECPIGEVYPAHA